MNTDAIRDLTLWARGVLTQEAGDLLRAVYGLKADGTFFPAKDMPALQSNAEAAETRRRLEQWMADEKDAEISPAAAVAKLLKEVAFTHLNRLVALKTLEHAERRVVRRAALTGYPEPNGFRMYLPDHEDDYKLYQLGTTPLDHLNESPRDRSYRHFLLWQYGQLAKEVRVLFDPNNLASRLFPRPKVLRQIIERLNAEALQDAWRPGNEETIGWVYQFFIAEEKAAAFKKVFKDKKKFLKEDIPAATQVFTPRWIVTFLVQNSLGRLWLSMHPDSVLATQWEYLVPPARDLPAATLKSVKELRLLDPATGTMHFGLVAFDLLVSMYREELANIGKRGWPKEPPVARDEDIPAAILANNLFGIDIDLRAVQLSALALYVRAKAHHRDATLTETNLACADVTMFRGPHRNRIATEMALPKGLSHQLLDQFCDALDEASMMGSLVRLERLFQEKLRADELRTAIDGYVRKKAIEGVDESYFGNETSKGLRLLDLLTRRYDVVFTNPPYMSSRNMTPPMKEFLAGKKGKKANYKDSSGDLYAAFIERCGELLTDGGRLAMITQQSFMFISTYEDLRLLLLGNTAIETMAHLGPRAFDEVQGEKVNTTAFVLRRESFTSARENTVGIYFRLVKEPDATAKRESFSLALESHRSGDFSQSVYPYRQGAFTAIPGSPWVYWADEAVRRLFSELPSLGSLYELDMGLKTSANARFVRCWWEIGQSRIGSPASREEAAAMKNVKWFWYAKGDKGIGISRLRYLANWHKDGAEIKAYLDHQYPYLNGNVEWCTHNEKLYFQPCITWSPVSSSGFKARIVPPGVITSNAAYGIFATASVRMLYGYLMSLPGRYLIKVLCSTINHNKGDIERLPVPEALLSDSQFLELINKAFDESAHLDEDDETSAAFIAPALLGGHRHARQMQIPDEINTYIARWLGLESQLAFIEEFLALPLDESGSGEQNTDTAEEENDNSDGASLSSASLGQEETASGNEDLGSLISYAVGVALGRFQPCVRGALGCGRFPSDVGARLRELSDLEGIMVLEEGHPDDLAQRVLAILGVICGDPQAEHVVRTVTESPAPLRHAIEQYLLGEFFRDHVKLYAKRPVYWLIQSLKKNYSIYLFHERATADTLSLLRGNRYLRGRINRLEQEQNALSEAVLRGERGSRVKAGRIAELLEELREFDGRIEAVTRVPAKDRSGRDITVRWEPERDDGVYINAAPLCEVLPSWRDVNPKKAWQELAAGEYDWSHTAMRYWPQRVLAKCKENKSYAIAHGLA